MGTYWDGDGGYGGSDVGYSEVGTPRKLIPGLYTYEISCVESGPPNATYSTYVQIGELGHQSTAIFRVGHTVSPAGSGGSWTGQFTIGEDGNLEIVPGSYTGPGAAPGNPLNNSVDFDQFYNVAGSSAGNAESDGVYVFFSFDLAGYDPGDPGGGGDPPPPPPEPGIGTDVTDPDGVFIATVEDAYDKVIQVVRNRPGTGAFKLDRYSPNATEEILRGGNIVKVKIAQIDADDYIFAFLLEDESVKLISSDEEGGEYWQIAGRGVLAYPERAIWLAESFVIPWWVGGTPPSAGDVGQIEVAAGSHIRYTIAGGVITAKTAFSVGAFTAFYDLRKSFRFTPSMGMGTTTRLLVRLSSGPQAGWYLHLFDDGFTDHFHSFALASTILLTDISPTKPGAVLYYLWQEATHANRPIHPTPGWTVDFTATLDSNGDPWTATDALIGMTAALGENYLTTIMKLVGTGFLEVVMDPDLTMHAYNTGGGGVDRTGAAFGADVVRFVKGVNIADELQRRFSTQPVATWAEIIGSDSAIAHAELADAASRIPRETSVKGETDDTAALEALGLAELRRQLVLSEGSKFKVLSEEDDEDVGHYLPGQVGTDHGKYWVFDKVTLATGTGESDFDDQDVDLIAITISEDDAGSLDVTAQIGSVPGGILSPAPHEVTVIGRGVGTGITGGTGSDGGGASGGSGLTSHDELAGLGNDDHPQYETAAEVAADVAAYAQPLDADLTAIAGLARTRGDLIRGGAAAWERLALGAAGKITMSDGTDLVKVDVHAAVSFPFGDGSAVIASGAICMAAVPRGTAWAIEYATISGEIGPDTAASIAFDVQVAAAALPTAAQSIIGGGTKPTLTTAKYAEPSIAGWTTAIDATSSHRVIRVVVDASPTPTAKDATLTLHLRRTA